MKRKLADCLVFTVRVSIPVKPMEPATIEAANTAIEQLESKLPPGAVIELVRAPTFGKCAVKELPPVPATVTKILKFRDANQVKTPIDPLGDGSFRGPDDIPAHLDRRVPRP